MTLEVYSKDGFVKRDDGMFIPRSLLTTKGDLLTRDGSDVKRLPIGSAGSVLTANSSGEVAWVGASRCKRWSLGVAPMPNSAGDYVQAYSNIGVTTSPYFALLSSSYPATGMLTIAALDLLAGSQNWRVRTFYNWLAGDTRLFYSAIVAANVTGTYKITSNVNVGAIGVYAEGTESGALNNPITVGGWGHRMYSYVGAWSDRSALVASGRQLFGAQCGFSSDITAVGWFGEAGLEVETL